MKKLALTVASVIVMSMSAYAAEAPKDYVIMKVNGDPVKKSEVEEVWKTIFPGENPPAFDTFDEKMRENVLRGVASEHILLKEAEKSGITNDPEVKAHIEQAKDQVIIRDFLRKKTEDLVSEEKLRAAYDAKVKSMEGSKKEEVRARHILVKTEEEAKEIAKKLKKGEDFEKIAKEKSEDKATGTAGGDLGYFTEDRMVPEFAKAAFALKKGEVSAPVKTDFGWHIIKLEDRRKATPPSFEELKESLRQEIGNKGVGEYVAGIMKSSKIVVMDAAGKEKEISAMPDKAPEDAAPAAGEAPAN